ncbi:MAG: transcription antitermination factor NusB [Alphaproteobacteria bacterium RIFCSPLOWO2_01_FULL_45_8]|nr:MAG: transcription antitermination factor NusB [Alphaproteobacteria bacterium GWA1_45_9]OFW89828.1 MAG: transcription antitermination factor NusB [Alphaproteobacteria bacterium RIFCSPHIGHO2_01_FULL_41_14]OFW96092.1 MAG: transcription antitermination factor NusB [Alphaproteobacteria bacterium RIFCSPLOWO2_01_FULL_45_8]HCI48960.1 transcription antitermination factor NusB [Holosporales bacterium]
MEEKKVSGYRKKSAARLAAVQVLYTKKMLDLSDEEALTNFQEHFLGKNLGESSAIKPDSAFLRLLVSGVCVRDKQLLELIEPNLIETWKIDRVDPIILNIIKCAVLEFLTFPEVDTPIIISEYLDVTHAFFDKKEVGFVNGILNKIGSIIRPSEEYNVPLN